MYTAACHAESKSRFKNRMILPFLGKLKKKTIELILLTFGLDYF